MERIRRQGPGMAADGRRPRVALVAWSPGDPEGPTGEPTRVIRRAAERFEVTVVSRAISPEAKAVADWRRIPGPGRPFRLQWLTFYAAAGLALRRLDVDLVHTWGAVPLVPGRVDLATVNFSHAGHLAALRAAGVRPGPRLLAAEAAAAIERRHYGRRTRMLAGVSASALADLARHYPSVPGVLTPWGVDTERFRPDAGDRARVRAELGAGDSELLVLFVARNWDVKGLAPAIEGLAVARRSAPVTLRLVVAGDNRFGSTPRRRFEALARRRGVSGAVRHLGFRADVARLYRAADVLVLPSLYETFSRAAHEAAASALPIVATRVHGIDDLVEQSGAGILVDRDPRAIGPALARLASDPQLRRRMGEAGRDHCRRLRPDLIGDGVLAAYDRLLAAR